jgi:YLATT-like protein
VRDIGMMILIFLAGAVAGGLIVNAGQANLHAWLLVGVMLSGGLLGGGVNYLLAKADEPPDTPSKASITRSLLAGIVAAFLVPLFLQMLSSNLLDLTRREPLYVLIFLGFCLVASVSSRAFITTISDKLINEVKQAREDAAGAKKNAADAQRKANAAVEGQAEAPPPPPGGARVAEAEAPSLGDDEISVLRSLRRPEFRFRYFFGVTNDARLDPDEAKKVLAKLEAEGLVAQTEDKENRKLYYLTSEGKAAVMRADAG